MGGNQLECSTFLIVTIIFMVDWIRKPGHRCSARKPQPFIYKIQDKLGHFLDGPTFQVPSPQCVEHQNVGYEISSQIYIRSRLPILETISQDFTPKLNDILVVHFQNNP